MSATTGSTNSSPPVSTWMTRDEWIKLVGDPIAKREWEQQQMSVDDLRADADAILVLGGIISLCGLAVVVVSLLLRRGNFAAAIGGTCSGGVVIVTSLGATVYFATRKINQFKIKRDEIERLKKGQDYSQEITRWIKKLLENGTEESKNKAESLQKRYNLNINRG